MATIIKSPARNIFICGTRPTEADIFPPPVPPAPPKVFGLAMDGVNDYLQPASYTQWDRTQPFTVQLFMTDRLSSRIFWDTRSAAGPFRGLFMGVASGLFLFQANNNTATNSYRKQATWGAGANHVAVAWNGSSAEFYFDGLPVAGTVTANTLSATIINALNRFTIFGRNDLSGGTLDPTQATLKNFSVVNYAKSGAEIAADYAAGFQSAGTGAYLLAYDFNVPEADQALTIVADTGPNLSIFGQTAPGDWVCIENC